MPQNVMSGDPESSQLQKQGETESLGTVASVWPIVLVPDDR
jgi:hypothetical protein